MNPLRARLAHLLTLTLSRQRRGEKTGPVPAALRRLTALALAVAAVALLGACSVGAYTVDYFQEMHYSPAVRRQEPPVMNVPPGAVAYRGLGAAEAPLVAAPPYNTMSNEELSAIETNGLADGPLVREIGGAVFARNCSMCHGAAGDGQGNALIVFSFPEEARPADLTGAETAEMTDGAIFAAVTNGQGTVAAPDNAGNPEAWAALTNMPPFEKLLTPEERWAVVWHIRGLQGR